MLVYIWMDKKLSYTVVACLLLICYSGWNLDSFPLFKWDTLIPLTDPAFPQHFKSSIFFLISLMTESKGFGACFRFQVYHRICWSLTRLKRSEFITRF